jgi:hypothetical protein
MARSRSLARSELEPMINTLRTSFMAAASTRASSASVDLPPPRNAITSTLGAPECMSVISSSWKRGVSLPWRWANSA